MEQGIWCNCLLLQANGNYNRCNYFLSTSFKNYKGNFIKEVHLYDELLVDNYARKAIPPLLQLASNNGQLLSKFFKRCEMLKPLPIQAFYITKIVYA